MPERVAEGPWFEELEHGQVFESSPAMTLTDGLAAVHQSIVGDRLPICLDHRLAKAVAGRAPLAHPGLVWDVAIGQSTTATHHVKANLFYRGLAFRRMPVLGDTLRTRTVVVGRRQNQPKPGRPPTGLVALRVTTVDQDEQSVLDFLRCAMIPLRDDVQTGLADDLAHLAADRAESDPVADFLSWEWDLEPIRRLLPAPPEGGWQAGQSWRVGGGDVVSGATELARLSLNTAMVHHDAVAAGGRRLVYGGHTIGLALHQATRAMPGLVTVLDWDSCDHLGPVHEGDTLRSNLLVTDVTAVPSGGSVVSLRSQVVAEPASAAPGVGTPSAQPVLDWRFRALCV